jgi:general secretion pathway protein C
MKLFDIGRHLGKRSGKASSRPPFEGIYAYLLAALIGYGVADYAVLSVRPKMLPKSGGGAAPTPRPPSYFNPPMKDYAGVFQRNIFNSLGTDPEKLSSGDGEQDSDSIEDQIAIQSQLPLTLEGTIVHANPKKSVATIVVKSNNESKSVGIDDEIENMVERITKIERRKVTFINKNSRRLEFIEIPVDAKLNLNFKGPTTSGSEEVAKRGEFDFAIKRGDVTKYLSDLSSVLGQARMQPNITPGSGGVVDGYRFTGIQPGSIYEKLGFKVQDVIKSVNGEPVNSPTKAMELYNSFKGQNNLELEVERNGRNEKFSYSITE